MSRYIHESTCPVDDLYVSVEIDLYQSRSAAQIYYISNMANYLFSHQPNGCGSPTVNDPSTYLSWRHNSYKLEKSQKS